MKLSVIASSILAGSSIMVTIAAFAASPYAGQEAREIKSLSQEDISAYQAGRGMGLAKTAELNGFAGPAHVLELATQLHLTNEQRARSEALFASMSTKASVSGRLLVERERELDTLFATRNITPARPASSLQDIGTLQAQIRDAHLEAHLAQDAILKPEQNVMYRQLRGYGGPEQTEHQHQH